MSPANPSPQGSGNPAEEEAERMWEPEGWRTPRKLGSTGSMHMWTQRLRQHAQVCMVRSRFSVYVIASSLVFLWDSQVCERVSLVLVPSLGLFSFCLFVLSNFDVIVLVLFCYMLLLSLRSLCFSNKRQKRSRSGWKGRWGETGRSREKGNHNWNLLCEKRICFQ